MIQAFLLTVITLGLLSFSSGGYYAQLAGGHVEVLLARQPISVLVQAQTTPLELKHKLSLVLRLRAYATRKLGLPENASYLTYTDIHRKFVVWNVTAVPEFSLNPLQWCFPLAGCVSYVGYFSEDRAHGYAAQLRGQGHDVYVRGISAYSTLGWLDDPETSAMLAWEDTRIADFIFHELAHQRLYVANDTPFNEAFATTVAKIGVRRWLSGLGTPLALAAFDQEKTSERAVISLVLRTRKLLRALYAASLRPADKRIAKSLLFEQMQKDYAELKKKWGGYAGYDAWMRDGLNNAKVSSLAIYHEHETAFETLFQTVGGNLREFYRLADQIGRLKATERAACMVDLAHGGHDMLNNCPGGVIQQMTKVRHPVSSETNKPTGVRSTPLSLKGGKGPAL